MRDAVLEREHELRVFEEALDEATSGTGSAVLVFGDAGIGKSSLIRAFIESGAARARVSCGAVKVSSEVPRA